MINDGNLLRCEGSWWGYAVNYYNSEAKKLNLVPVTSVDITLNAAAQGKVFDLRGRRVSRAGRGIYIVNGKKIVK